MELHLSPKVVNKGPRGRTACGSAAYRSCSRIVDNNGIIHNFKRKAGYVTGGIELPAGAPSELRDPQTLWQRHEAKDVRKDAQLFREIEMAFPNELDTEAQIRIIKSLMQPLVDQGMCYQWDIHNAKKKNKPENKHVHIMLTMRELNADGTFGNKVREWNRFNGGMNIADLLRPEAARLMNVELQAIGSAERVEHESFESRGIDRVPTKHVGVAGIAMEQRGELSYRAEMRRITQELNNEHITYVERMKRLREARATLHNAISQRDGERASLFDKINSAEKIASETASEEIKESVLEDVYQEIKQCNQQIYDLKREKKQNEKLNKALHLMKNLAGDPDLTEEQIKQLNWAYGYLKWAGLSDEELKPKAVYQKIDELREDNVARCLEISAAEQRKFKDLERIKQIKTTEKTRSEPSKQRSEWSL